MNGRDGGGGSGRRRRDSGIGQQEGPQRLQAGGVAQSLCIDGFAAIQDITGAAFGWLAGPRRRQLGNFKHDGGRVRW